jgi:NAD(P)-dependent dehydrogenase (short-subunit alcohol dehydrogenase family)
VYDTGNREPVQEKGLRAEAGVQLANRVALVVGGGNGLGRAVACAYAREGAALAVADLDLAAAAESLRLAGRPEGLAVPLDVSDPAACRAAVAAVEARFGRLDILCNCAAILLVDPLLEVSPERWERVFAVNVRGAFFIMQAAARGMVARGFGRVVQISSPASRLGTPFFASYAASKAAVDSLVRSAALAWAAHGVTVNAISPGRMTGGMIDKLEADLARVTGQAEEQSRAARTQGLPMGRRVAPQEVAEAAVWLASDAVAYVTAERFNFTGGMELG